MSEFLGPIAIPVPATSGVFPLRLEYGLVHISAPQIVSHQFGHADAQAEQRFYLGAGKRTFQLSLAAIPSTHKDELATFFDAHRGSYEAFSLQVAEQNGSVTTYTVRFANPNLTLEQFSECVWSGSIELVEVPSTTPTYTSSNTQTRFPNAALKTALLSQVQELVPLVKITATDGTAMYISDRRVSVDGNLYQPRLVDWDGISQSLNGASDSARLTLGNADRVLTQLVNSLDLDKAELQFSLFHVGSTTKIDLWLGYVTTWSFDAGPTFQLTASDGLYQLRLPYPSRKITRQDGFTVGDQPVSVGGKKGIDRINATSVINDTAYGKPLRDVYVADSAHPLPVKCDVIAGRDESEFYAALGVIGRGPISAFGAGHTFDGKQHHGPGNMGLRRAFGGNWPNGSETAQNNAPDGNSDKFAIDNTSGSWPPDTSILNGVSFIQIRTVDEKGVQPVKPEGKEMIAYVAGGLGCYTWSAAGVRSFNVACTNPIWIAINTLLYAKGKYNASVSEQEALFDVQAAITAASHCDETVDKLIGSGTEKQFTFTGIIEVEKPLRDWIQEILGSCLAYHAFSFGKMKVGIRFDSSVVEPFTIANIVHNSLQVAAFQPEFNDLTVSFADFEYGYQQNALNLVDEDSYARVREKTKANINLVGTSTKSQASRICTTKLREVQGGLTASEKLRARQLSFKTTVLALNTEPGMVCSMTHPDMPNGSGEFRVQSWTLNRDYSIDIQGSTTTDSMYNMLIGDKPTDVSPDAIPVAENAVPDDVRAIGAEPFLLESVANNGAIWTATLKYDPPSPVGPFNGVNVFYEDPADSGSFVSAGSYAYNGTEAATGTDRYGTASLQIALPLDAAKDWNIVVCPKSAFHNVIPSLNRPHKLVSVSKAVFGGEANLPVKSPLDYGAVGDGVADDTAAVQQCANENDAWEVPGGYTFVVDHLAINFRSNINISGYGVLRQKAGAGEAATFLYIGSTTNISIDGITMDGNRANQTRTNGGIGIRLVEVAGIISIRNVRVVDTDYEGFAFNNPTWTAPTAITLENLYIGNSGNGACVDIVSQTTQQMVTISNCIFTQAYNNGIWLYNVDAHISGVTSIGNGAYGIALKHGTSAALTSCDLSGNLYGALYVDPDSSYTSYNCVGLADNRVPVAIPLPIAANNTSVRTRTDNGVPKFGFRISITANANTTATDWYEAQAKYWNDSALTDADSDWIPLGGVDPTKLTMDTDFWDCPPNVKYSKVRIAPKNSDNKLGEWLESTKLTIPASTGIIEADGSALAVTLSQPDGPSTIIGESTYRIHGAWTPVEPTVQCATYQVNYSAPGVAEYPLGIFATDDGVSDSGPWPRPAEDVPATITFYPISIDGVVGATAIFTGPLTITAGAAGTLDLSQGVPKSLTGDQVADGTLTALSMDLSTINIGALNGTLDASKVTNLGSINISTFAGTLDASKVANLGAINITSFSGTLDVSRVSGLSTIPISTFSGTLDASHVSNLGTISISTFGGTLDASRVANLGSIAISTFGGSLDVSKVANLNTVNISTFSGVIVTQQIADGFLSDLAKFAADLRPITKVTSLPTLPNAAYPVSTIVLNGADSKLYKNSSGTWTLVTASDTITGKISSGDIISVAGGTINGQINAGCITHVQVNQFAGTLSAAQCAAISINSFSGSIGTLNAGTVTLTGTWSDSQIGSISAGKLTAGTITAAVSMTSPSLTCTGSGFTVEVNNSLGIKITGTNCYSIFSSGTLNVYGTGSYAGWAGQVTQSQVQTWNASYQAKAYVTSGGGYVECGSSATGNYWIMVGASGANRITNSGASAYISLSGSGSYVNTMAGYAVNGTYVIDSARNVNCVAISASSTISSSSYINSASGYRVGGTSVIDGSRNISGASLSLSSTISCGGITCTTVSGTLVTASTGFTTTGYVRAGQFRFDNLVSGIKTRYGSGDTLDAWYFKVCDPNGLDYYIPVYR